MAIDTNIVAAVDIATEAAALILLGGGGGVYAAAAAAERRLGTESLVVITIADV